MSEQYLTPKEVARRLSVSDKTVYRLTQSGKLPCIHIGRSVRIAESAVEAFLSPKKGRIITKLL